MPFNYLSHNRKAWNTNVEKGNNWTKPVSTEVIENARNGKWSVILTPHKPVPRDWFGDIKGKDILCLAGSGGQQAPVFAAAGANVISFDLSDKQLEQDRFVADRDNLILHTVQGDMQDLSALRDLRFDIIFHPVSNCFIPDVKAVWREAYRVLKKGGVLLSGVVNPVAFIFDDTDYKNIELKAVNKIPYADLEQLSQEKIEQFKIENTPFEYGHTLQDLIGGQIEAGFIIDGFYDDYHINYHPLNNHIPAFFATRARKV